MNWIIGNIEFPEYYWTKSDPPQEFSHKNMMLPPYAAVVRRPNETP